MWPQELCWLYDTFRKSRTHAEVGAFCGRSLFASSVGMEPGSTVIAVEPFLLDDLADNPGPAWVKHVFKGTVTEIQKHNVDIIHSQKKSLDAIHDFQKMRFDSVFIDASHHYADVACDIQCWMPLIKSGGIIAGHDYWPRDPGVMDAVSELIPNFRVVDNTRIWYGFVQ
jgi:hypothetical protein